MYGLSGRFHAQPGRRDDLVAYLLRAAALLERDAGCLAYVVSTTDDADAVHVFEVWTDRDAHERSLEPEDVRALISEARPLIAGMSGRTELDVQGGVGLAPA